MSRNSLTLFIAAFFFLGCGLSQKPDDEEPSSQASHESRTSKQSEQTQRQASFDYPAINTPVEGLVQRPDDIAIIVGIEEYVFLPNVNGARQTAFDWEDFFRDSLGIRTVYTLLDADANREDISAYLAESGEDISQDARIWFVFVGHGAPGANGTDGLLVGMDARQNLASLTARSLTRSSIIDTLSAGSTDDVVVVLDTCFSGQTPEGAQLIEGAQPVLPVIEPQSSDTGAIVLSAAGSDQLAGPLPGVERPSFSYLLLGAFRGWAVDGQGDVSAANAHQYTERELRQVSSRRQRPQIEGPGERVLIRNASERAPDLQDLLSGRGNESPPRQTTEHSARESTPQPSTSQPSPRRSSSSSQTLDLGRGLHIELEEEWRLTENSQRQDDSHIWLFAGFGGEVGINLWPGKGSFYEENVQTLVDGALHNDFELLSAVDDFSIPPYTGHLRTFHIPAPVDGEDKGLTLFFVRNGRDLWFFSATFAGTDDALDRFMEAFVHLVSMTTFQ